MTAELSVAVEEMQSRFNAAWTANAGAVLGYIPEIEWHGVEDANNIDRSFAWVRFSTQNLNEPQRTLSDCVGAPFQKRYEAYGLIFVQLFIPKGTLNPIEGGRKLAEVARNAFRGKKTESGVVFKNVRINDNIAPEELFYRINVVAEYEFDLLG